MTAPLKKPVKRDLFSTPLLNLPTGKIFQSTGAEKWRTFRHAQTRSPAKVLQLSQKGIIRKAFSER
jgi:hypothetical protein